jgi:hypothetical protein
MPALILLIAALLLPAGPWAAQAPGKVVYPKKPGIYAMTLQGPVEMKISGERNELNKALGLKSYYSPDALDRIPAAESVRSFYVSVMDWQPRDLFLVVGREHLSGSFDSYQRFNGRMVSRGVVAFEILSDDLESPEFVLRAVRKLAPAGIADPDIEAYVVLELRSTSGLNARDYPIRIQVPKG